MPLQDRIRAAHSFEATRFLPFVVDGERLGYVRRDLAPHLLQFADIFDVGSATVTFKPALDSFEIRSSAMADVARQLAAQGLLSRWRAEAYDIGARNDRPAMFIVERAAVRFFGFTARAIHVNGLVEDGAKGAMWIARRSPNKAIDPSMLDNMVGGGVATGLSIQDTVVKEAWEEAGIPAELAARAQAMGSVRILREVPEGLHAEIIYVHDLSMPADFVPQNQDGEVAEFRRIELPEVLRELEGDADYTVDAGIVALDCLARLGARGARD